MTARQGDLGHVWCGNSPVSVAVWNPVEMVCRSFSSALASPYTLEALLPAEADLYASIVESETPYLWSRFFHKQFTKYKNKF
jgi:hypothetical protein